MIFEELFIYKKGGNIDYTLNANYKGEWDAYTNYLVGEIVLYSGTNYEALLEGVYKLPTSYTNYWSALPTYDPNLIVDYKEVDIKDTSIVRSYKTPYFSDANSVLSDTTKTITLPQTERNSEVMEYLHHADMNTDFPYKYHYADYFQNGMQIISGGRVNVLADFEIQIVYGVNREKYLPLKEKKCNEIVVNGTTILESDWLVNWNKIDMFVPDKQYKYLDSISGERVSDVETINGIIQPKIIPDEPYLSNIKEMTQHPFITCENILKVISIDAGLTETKYFNLITEFQPIQDKIVFTTDISTVLKVGDILETLNGNMIGFTATIIAFDGIYTAQFSGDISEFYLDNTIAVIYGTRYLLNNFSNRLDNKGVIENTDNLNLNQNLEIIYDGIPETSKALKLQWDLDPYSIFNSAGYSPFGEYEFIYSNSFDLNRGMLGLKFPFKFIISLNFTISDNVGGIKLVAYKTNIIPEIPTVITTIPIASTISGKLIYNYTFDLNIEESNKTWRYQFLFDNGTINNILDNGGVFSVSYIQKNSIFSFNGIYGGIEYLYNGHYDCLANLPNITQLNFIQQMLIHTCGFIGYDVNGDFKFYFFDEFVTNYSTSNVYDWSGKISNVRNSKYQFNSNAQKNYIKFNNDKDLTNRSEYVTVNDTTLQSERDLYTLELDSPLGNEGEKSEYILYEQTVKRSGTDGVSFENKYVGDKWSPAFVEDIDGIATNINIIGTSYATYQKLINRPIVGCC